MSPIDEQSKTEAPASQVSAPNVTPVAEASSSTTSSSTASSHSPKTSGPKFSSSSWALGLAVVIIGALVIH